MYKILFFLFIASFPLFAQASWQYRTPIDKMSGKAGKIAFTDSTNKIHNNGLSIDENAKLIIIEHPRYGMHASLLLAKSQFVCSTDGCDVLIRFDNQKPIKTTAYEPDDGSTNIIIISLGYEFISKILESKTMYIESQIFRSGLQTMEFNVAGLNWDKPATASSKEEEIDIAYKCMKKAQKLHLDTEEEIGFEQNCKAYYNKFLNRK